MDLIQLNGKMMTITVTHRMKDNFTHWEAWEAEEGEEEEGEAVAGVVDQEVIAHHREATVHLEVTRPPEALTAHHRKAILHQDHRLTVHRLKVPRTLLQEVSPWVDHIGLQMVHTNIRGTQTKLPLTTSTMRMERLIESFTFTTSLRTITMRPGTFRPFTCRSTMMGMATISTMELMATMSTLCTL